jgi:hypothetical protein
VHAGAVLLRHWHSAKSVLTISQMCVQGTVTTTHKGPRCTRRSSRLRTQHSRSILLMKCMVRRKHLHSCMSTHRLRHISEYISLHYEIF